MPAMQDANCLVLNPPPPAVMKWYKFDLDWYKLTPPTWGIDALNPNLKLPQDGLGMNLSIGAVY